MKNLWADAPTHVLILCNVKDVSCLIDGKLLRFGKEISGYPDQQTGEWRSGKWYACMPDKPMTVLRCRHGLWGPGLNPSTGSALLPRVLSRAEGHGDLVSFDLDVGDVLHAFLEALVACGL